MLFVDVVTMIKPLESQSIIYLFPENVLNVLQRIDIRNRATMILLLRRLLLQVQAKGVRNCQKIGQHLRIHPNEPRMQLLPNLHLKVKRIHPKVHLKVHLKIRRSHLLLDQLILKIREMIEYLRKHPREKKRKLLPRNHRLNQNQILQKSI